MDKTSETRRINRVGNRCLFQINVKGVVKIKLFVSILSSRKERIPRFVAILRYTVLSEGSFESPIVFLQLLLAVALERRPT